MLTTIYENTKSYLPFSTHSLSWRLGTLQTRKQSQAPFLAGTHSFARSHARTNEMKQVPCWNPFFQRSIDTLPACVLPGERESGLQYIFGFLVYLYRNTQNIKECKPTSREACALRTLWASWHADGLRVRTEAGRNFF